MIETLLFALGFNLLLFVIAYSLRTDKLTDVGYALTFVGIATYGVLTNTMGLVKWLVVALVVAWAWRLGSYLLRRIRFTGRDKRFDAMRDDFWKFGRFWLLQALVAWTVMLPVTLLLQITRQPRMSSVVLIGLVIALVGLAIETIADRQKFNFMKQPENKEKWMASGLWNYSRHPNYFGEILMWYGVFVISYSFLSQQNSWIAAIGPLAITVMLVAVSGIPLLEKSADKRWGNNKDYQEYKRRTSLLILMPPKK
jgi:steroid 5-alpha reductase family enzyme